MQIEARGNAKGIRDSRSTVGFGDSGTGRRGDWGNEGLGIRIVGPDLSPSWLRLGLRVETNSRARWQWRRLHQMANRGHQRLDRHVVGVDLPLQLVESKGKLLVGAKQLAEPYESPYT